MTNVEEPVWGSQEAQRDGCAGHGSRPALVAAVAEEGAVRSQEVERERSAKIKSKIKKTYFEN